MERIQTGTVVFALKDTDENRSVNVSNVEKVEKLLDKIEVLYQVSQFGNVDAFFRSSSDRDHAWRDHAAFLSYEPSGKRGECKSDELRKAAPAVNHDEIKVTFANVAGLQEEKEELAEIVDFLKAPKKYVQVGARIRKGVFVGRYREPGKTFLQKLLQERRECRFPVFQVQFLWKCSWCRRISRA